MGIRFEWDAAKAKINIKKHCVRGGKNKGQTLKEESRTCSTEEKKTLAERKYQSVLRIY